MDKPMSFIKHLSELRRRLVFSVLAWLLLSCGWFVFSDQVLAYVSAPIPAWAVLAPTEAFYVRLKLAATLGLCLCSPLIAFQGVRFISPALRQDERRLLYLTLPWAFVLFMCGISFSYYIMLPLLLTFFLSFAKPAQLYISIGSYIDFIIGTTLPIGFVFQWPVIVVLLTKLRFIQPSLLKNNRRYVLLLCLVLAAWLTPPDVFSQLLLLLPLLALYEVSIGISCIVFSRSRGN